MPNVVTIPNVELAKIGVHEISTGTWTVTRQDLADAVAAYKAGLVRDPVITLGHVGGRGAPAFGRVRNLRLAQAGAMLVGDFVDVPRALAAVMGSAWPQRSVEGLTGYTGSDGREYGFVLTAVALLGAELPGVDGLSDVDDVAALYGVAARSARRVILAAAPASDRAARERAVRVAAARRRRTQITIGA
ncbi:hypothetical protein MYSE111917_16625 [Mycobacterium senriense]|uniref:hypothetical protein n=1 Tax=Mycobacterium senriense TaxID=2775496 RepID=UPI001C825417|nr:hypothetical protein [Mycobacterium senriense]